MKNFEIGKAEKILIVAIIILIILLFISLYIGHNSERICNEIINKNYEALIEDECINKCIGGIRWNTNQTWNIGLNITLPQS